MPVPAHHLREHVSKVPSQQKRQFAKKKYLQVLQIDPKKKLVIK